MYHLKKRFMSPSNHDYKREYMKFVGDMIENSWAKRAPTDADAKPGMTFTLNLIITEQDIWRRQS